jgi:UPF0755 protein
VSLLSGPASPPPHDWEPDPWDDADVAPVVEPVRRQTRTIRWLVWSSFVVAISLILLAGYTGWWYIQKLNPGITTTAPVTFTIDEGDTVETISERLLAEGIIVDAGVFQWYVERQGGLEITPGYYEVLPGDHMGNILGRFRTPPGQTFSRVTFPEGFTVEQMARRVDTSLNRMTAEGFLEASTSSSVQPRLRSPGQTSLEGLLFPDTYQVSNSESEGQLIERMVALMERVARQENLEERAAELGQTPYEILIIASMIEREAKLDVDRAKISAVIRNRLFVGMPLQIDATLYYGQDPDTPFSQLRSIDSPYNTYLYPGLPPTPIANPGRASIRAALYPAPPPPPSDPACRTLDDPTTCFYLYYVLADERGGHVFAHSYEQHLENVERSRRAGLLG